MNLDPKFPESNTESNTATISRGRCNPVWYRRSASLNAGPLDLHEAARVRNIDLGVVSAPGFFRLIGKES